MDATHTNDELTPVDAEELDLVARLLAVMSPVEVGPHPGAQLSRTRSGHVWTFTDGAATVDVRSSGSIGGLDQPVWMTARAVWFAAWTAGPDGSCSLGIDDRRQIDGTLHALVRGQLTDARIDLPNQGPVSPLRPPEPSDVIATATTDMAALLRAVQAASLTPAGVAVTSPPVGTFMVAAHALFVGGAPHPGADLTSGFRLRADTEGDTSAELQVQVDLAPLVTIGEHLPGGEVIVSLTRTGELWLIAGPCRVVLRCQVRRLRPTGLEGIVYLVGRVEGTEEPVLSLDGDCPVDGVTVWLESRPDLPEVLEQLEEHHDIVWYAEPEPYGVSIPRD